MARLARLSSMAVLGQQVDRREETFAHHWASTGLILDAFAELSTKHG